MYTSAMEMVFDGTPLSMYGLYLMDSKTGSEEVDMGARYKIISDTLNGINYTFGMAEDGILSFEMCLMSMKPLSAYDISNIAKVLFNHRQYKKLEVLEESYLNKYVMCKLNSPSKVMVGNLCYGFRFEVECDGQYWYEHEINRVISNNMIIHNTCDSNNIVPLEVEIVANSNTNAIVRNNNANVETRINNMLQGEVITLNSRLQTIKSNKMSYIYDRFNLEWMDLFPGTNLFQITGDVKVKFKYQFRRRG